VFQKRKTIIVFLVFLSAFLFRLLLTPVTHHVDIYSNAHWGEVISGNGAKGFYEFRDWVYSWPTQPPLMSLVYGMNHKLYLFFLETLRDSANIIVKYHLAPGHMVWWFNFVIWFDNPLTTEIWFPVGYLSTIKLLPILADLGIAAIILLLANKVKAKNPAIWPTIYLFSPFSWYLSALWGQYDQVGFLLLLLSFYLLSKRKLVLSPLLFSLSMAMKPTSLIFVPFYLFLYYKNSPKLKECLLGLMFVALVQFLSIKAFTNEYVIAYIQETLIPIIFYKSEMRISTNSFNFWHVFTRDKIFGESEVLFLFPTRIWGLIVFAVLNFFAMSKTKVKEFQTIIFGMFVVGFGGWLFITNMLERYAFAGIASGLILCLYYPRLIRYWFALSIIYWVNLYRNWWFPESLIFIKSLLDFNNGILGVLFSLGNVVIFTILIKKIKLT
jgi:Gpi18-like mannosyltransferase